MPFLAKVLNLLIWLPLVLFWLVLWPFAFLYGLVLCMIATYVLVSKGRDVLIVQNSARSSADFSVRLQELPLSADRLLFLDYASHKQWSWWSLPARLFWSFGPIPMPSRFTPDFLPAVLVLRKFRRPNTFSFGTISKDKERKFDELLAELNRNRSSNPG